MKSWLSIKLASLRVCWTFKY